MSPKEIDEFKKNLKKSVLITFGSVHQGKHDQKMNLNGHFTYCNNQDEDSMSFKSFKNIIKAQHNR